MRVLFVSSGNSKEPINSLILNQANSLIKEGCDIKHFLIKGKGWLGYFLNIFKLRNYLKQNNFDIIHAHYGLCGITSSLAKRNEKLIISFMGDDVLGSNNFAGKITFQGKIFNFLNRLIARFSANYIIVKTIEMADKLQSVKYKLSIIPNGVDIQMFMPLDKKISRQKLKLSEGKTFAVFVANPLRPEKNFKLAEMAAKKAGIELLVIFEKSQDEVKDFYNAADMLILTSYHEGSVNVIKEAMACNCPIVSTDVGDVRKTIGETEGCFFCNFDLNDILEKINYSLKFVIENNRTKGRNQIIKLGLDSETIAKKILNVYLSLTRK